MIKRLFLFTFTSLLFNNYLNAQLEVNDTILMAFSNGTFWKSSSELESSDDSYELEMGAYADFGKYGSIRLSDNDPSTCWAEGSESNGIGEYILFTIPDNILNLKIKNGYQKNENLYLANNRAKIIEFTLYASYEPVAYVTESHNGFFISEPIISTKAELKDKMGYQDVMLGFDWEEVFSKLENDKTFDKDRFILKITIREIYKGVKWNDACISDIEIVPNPYYNLTADEHGLLKTSSINTDTLFYYIENIYQVVEVSQNSEWVIFIEMPANIENSRAETIYKLYNTTKEEFIDIKDIYAMYGFVKKSGELYIEVSDNDFNDIQIKLDEL